ncbi:hypothetical protein KSS87_013393 [Heliosperma pusillum]|nr:hypothetical protein KSS87_013393 [Heliosperma pusillum]
MDEEPKLPPSPPPPSSLFPISTTTTTTTTPPPLFPISATAISSTTPQWLHNTSFTTDLSTISSAPSANDIDSEPEPIPKPKQKQSYELLESSDEERSDKRRKRKMKKKKRKRDNDDVSRFSYGSRKSGVRAWDDSQIKPSTKDYYFDSKGDPDNLAFGCLYRMDIVRYKHDEATRLTSDLQVYSRLSHQSLLVRGELDIDRLDAQTKSGGRYWSAKYSALERDKNFKHIRVVAPKKYVEIMLDDFIPFFDEDGNGSTTSGHLVTEESWEDEVLRKTRDFNKMTREHPHNIKVWLDFAEFQDKVASRQPQKGARLQTLEKKISILEKAVELNPEDEDLVIYLLKAYGTKDSADILIGKWEKVLMQHYGSHKLWREFLHVVQGDFSTFKVSELRKMFAHAIQALTAASSKKHRQKIVALFRAMIHRGTTNLTLLTLTILPLEQEVLWSVIKIPHTYTSDIAKAQMIVIDCLEWVWNLWMVRALGGGDVLGDSIFSRVMTTSTELSYRSKSWVEEYNKDHPAEARPCVDHVDIEIEHGIVDIFLSLCRFEWQAGYHELATALFQAELEYCLFCPPLHLTEQNKKRLLEHFWNGNGARVGEDGALGWSTWLEREEETRQKLLEKASLEEDEQGGWTGWFAPSSKDKENSPQSKADGSDVALEGLEEEKEDEDANLEEDDASLLRMLGIDAGAEANSEVHESTTWVRWSEEELLKDREQWMPVRGNSAVSPGDEEMVEADEQLSRVIFFEDVSDYLFSLSSPEARLSLVVQFIDFFGVEVSQCSSTNSSSWNEKLLSLETLPDSLSKYIRNLNGAGKLKSGSSTLSLESLLQSPDSSARREIMNFLRNAVLLCLKVFPRNYKLEEAILCAEEKAKVGFNTLQQTAMPSRALAKNLLKTDRQDILLCGVYARREAAFGNIDLARKVFDMALSSISGLHSENQPAPMLYLWYSEMELAGIVSSNSESTSRALHILSCLGSGTAYIPYKGRPSSTQLLRAHQGFKERINAIRSSWVREVVSDGSVALVCSAALFEQLMVGWAAGVKMLSDALSMVLPDGCFHYGSSEREQPLRVKNMGNTVYIQPRRPYVCGVKLSCRISSYIGGANQSFVYCIFSIIALTAKHERVKGRGGGRREGKGKGGEGEWRRKPSIILALFALSYELSRGGSQHRIHGLFERALTNDKLRFSVFLWRLYIAFEIDMENISAARRVFFRAIHACPWSKMLWLDGFQKLNNILSAKELSDLQEVMREKELNLRTDIYEILLRDELTAKL